MDRGLHGIDRDHFTLLDFPPMIYWLTSWFPFDPSMWVSVKFQRHGIMSKVVGNDYGENRPVWGQGGGMSTFVPIHHDQNVTSHKPVYSWNCDDKGFPKKQYWIKPQPFYKLNQVVPMS